MPNKYVDFVKVGDEYEVWNLIYDQKVGVIKKARMGQWMHWQLFWDIDELKKDINKLFDYSKGCNEIQWQEAVENLFKNWLIGFTNGCLKEITPFITSLYRQDRRQE